MAAASSNEFQFTVPETAQNAEVKLRPNVTVPCHLSPEMSAVNMEIKCVCVCKNRHVTEGWRYKGKANLVIHEGNVSLLLRDFKDMGDYLCQVISQDTTVELTVQVNDYSDVQPVNQPPTSQSYPLTRHEENQLQEKNMVINEKTAPEKSVKEPETLRKTEQMKKSEGPLHKSVAPNDNLRKENEKHPTELNRDRNPQGENKEVSKPSSEKERAAKTPSIQSERRKIKLCSILAGKTNISPERFIGTLKKQIPNLMEVSMDESDIVLVFCQIVSQAVTDIEVALKRFTDCTASKLKVLVVLHHTFDPEKTVPDSSRCVNRTDILTVDCLFYEETGLLKCQKNDDAINKIVNWLIQQAKSTGVNEYPPKNKSFSTNMTQNQLQEKNTRMRINEKRPTENSIQEPETLRKTEQMKKSGGIKLFSDFAVKTNGGHKKFFQTLENRIKDLREVPTVDESDIFLVYCPVVSRHDINIEAALKRFTDSTASKLKVLVVLHHTFDPEKTVPDSSRCVNRTDILTVDCLFYEDTGLLKCQKNDEAINKVVNLLRQQAKSTGVNEYPPKNKSTVSTDRTQRIKLGSSSNRATAKTSTAAATSLTSAAPYAHPMSRVKYFVTLPGHRQQYHIDFLNALHTETHAPREVSTVQESDVILDFHSESLAALKDDKRTDKPVVDIVLHETLDSKSVQKSSGCLNNPDGFVVDCVICEGVEELPECNINREAIAAVSQWLSTKYK